MLTEHERTVAVKRMRRYPKGTPDEAWGTRQMARQDEEGDYAPPSAFSKETLQRQG